jgi:hypothetical protein
MTWFKEETMLVHPVAGPGSGARSWTVLGDDDVPVAPVDRFLAYLTGIGRSPNTVKAYSHDLKDYWEFLGLRGLDWREARRPGAPRTRPVRQSSDVRRRGRGSRSLAVVALYTADISGQIRWLRQQRNGTGSATAIPVGQRATNASLRARLTTALDRNKQLADDNARLRRQLARALGDQRSARTRSGNNPAP